jgi:hypothetical protein
MAQRIGGVVAGIVSAVLCAYWLSWAYLLMTAEIRQLVPRLERESARLRRLCWRSSAGGALLLEWLDRHALAVWHRVNRPFFTRFNVDGEDVVSAVGRFEFAETPAWVLSRSPIGRPPVCRQPLNWRRKP